MNLTLGGPGVVGNTIMLNVHYKRLVIGTQKGPTLSGRIGK